MSILGRPISLKVIFATMLLMVVLALLPVMTSSQPREIRLIARDMAFYLENNPAPNPTIDVKAGETVRIVIRNHDSGILHDFAVPAVRVGIDLLQTNEQGAVTFDVPATAGLYEYVCRPHLLMMKGVLRVVP